MTCYWEKKIFIYFRAEKNLPDSEDDNMLVHSSVTTGVDGDEPKEPSNNDTQSKYFKFSTFIKFWKEMKYTVGKQIKLLLNFTLYTTLN